MSCQWARKSHWEGKADACTNPYVRLVRCDMRRCATMKVAPKEETVAETGNPKPASKSKPQSVELDLFS